MLFVLVLNIILYNYFGVYSSLIEEILFLANTSLYFELNIDKLNVKFQDLRDQFFFLSRFFMMINCLSIFIKYQLFYNKKT